MGFKKKKQLNSNKLALLFTGVLSLEPTTSFLFLLVVKITGGELGWCTEEDMHLQCIQHLRLKEEIVAQSSEIGFLLSAIDASRRITNSGG